MTTNKVATVFEETISSILRDKLVTINRVLDSNESIAWKKYRVVDEIKSLERLYISLHDMYEAIKGLPLSYGLHVESPRGMMTEIVNCRQNILSAKVVWHSNTKVHPCILQGLTSELFDLDEVNDILHTNFNRLWLDVASHNNGLYPTDWAYHYISHVV